MSHRKCLFLSFFVFTSLTVSTSLAEQEFVGTVSGRSAGQLAVRLPDGETRHIRVNESTRFFNQGAPVPQRRVLPHTVVRVEPKDGTALAITILEAPK